MARVIGRPTKWWHPLVDQLFFLLELFVFDLLPRFFVNIEVRGQENIPKSGNVLYVVNHRHFLGTLLILGRIFCDWIFFHPEMYPANIVNAKHLDALKLPAWLITYMRMFPLREDTRDKAYQFGVNELTGENSCSLILFAEGTRAKEGEDEMKSFRHGVGEMVQKTRPRQILFVLDDDTKVFYKSWFPRWCGYKPTVFTVSKVFDASDPESELGQLCETGTPKEVAEKLQEIFDRETR